MGRASAAPPVGAPKTAGAPTPRRAYWRSAERVPADSYYTHLDGVDDLIADEDRADDHDSGAFVQATLAGQRLQCGFDGVLRIDQIEFNHKRRDTPAQAQALGHLLGSTQRVNLRMARTQPGGVARHV